MLILASWNVNSLRVCLPQVLDWLAANQPDLVGLDKFCYKLDWLDALSAYLQQQRQRYPNLVVAGDFNIAPEDRDVHDPQAWQGSVLVSEPEREKFRQLLALGFKDSFRLFDQPEGAYSWWDYRAAAFRRNLGLRIDHILVSDNLADKVWISTIDKGPRKLERPSDHAPVVANLSLS